MEPERPQRNSFVARSLRASGFLLLGLAASLCPATADAQVLTKVGSFAPPTGGAPNQNQSIVGVGFQPRAVVFYWTAQTTTGFAPGALVGYGFASGPGSERAVNFLSDDNLALNNAKRSQWTDHSIVVTDSSTAGTVNARATLISMDGDGFTVRWQPRGSGGWIIHYMALGGPDVTPATVGSFTPAAGTGSESVTGLGFQPDFLMFLSIDSNAVASVVTDGKVSVGFAGRSSAHGVTQGGSTAVSRAGGLNIVTSGAQLSAAAILEKDTTITASSPTHTAAVTSFDVDGFTINKTVNTAGTETVVHYLALHGGQYRVGAIARPTTAGAQTVPYTGVGFTPKGLLFSSWNLVQQVYDEDARISFSAADNATPFNQRATFFHDKLDNPSDNDNSWVRQGTSGTVGVNGRVVYLAQAGDCPPKFAEGTPPLQCSAGPRIISEADVASYDPDGFTLNWTTNDLANANQIPGDEANAQTLYVAFGDTPAPERVVTKVGSFFADQFTGSQSIVNVGFQPKAVIFFWTRQEIGGFSPGAQVGYGFATGPGSERAVNYLSDDNLPPASNSTSRWQWTNRCIVVTNTSTAGTTSHEATFVSMDADGFTLNWTKATSGVNYIVHYLALGGADITSATTGTFTPAAGTGAQSVTGLGFQPDFLMFLSIDSNTTGVRVSPHGKVSLGFAASGTSITQASLTAATRSAGANAITSGAQAHDAALLEKDFNTAILTLVASVAAFDADGFTINKTINAAGTETDVHFLALRGGRYRVGTITRPATETPPNLFLSYTGVGFPPKALLFSSWGQLGSAVDPTGDSEARISLSAVDSTPTGFNQRAIFFHDKTDNPSTGDYMLVRQNTSGTVGANGKVVYLAQAGSCPPNPLYLDPAGPLQCSGAERVIAEADVASYDPDGFTLNWTTNDITNTNDWFGDERDARIFTVAFGPQASSVDLAIAKDDSQTAAVPGTAVTYTITVMNNGPDTVTSLTLTDVPTAILGPVFAPSAGTYNSGTGEWTGLNLAPTQFVTLTLSGTIDPFARGSLVNTVNVAPPAGVADPNGANNTATDTDSLVPSADLGLTKLDELDPVSLGSVLVYTLAVTNGGPSGATGVTLTDTLPPGLSFESATPTQGTCSYVPTTRTVTCNLVSIGPGLGATVTLRVRPQAVGTLVNTASVLGNEPDPAGGNNTATETTVVEISSIGVRFFTVTSTSENNVLEWVNPTADYASTEIVFRTDRYPAASGDGTVLYNAGVAGGQEKLPHLTGVGSNGVMYYYAAFVHRTVPPAVSPGRFCTGRPFDTSGPAKWSFSTGATAVSPPTVGGAGVVAPSNDRVLYAMERGPLAPGGEWPANWWPIELGDVVQSRSPVVPISVQGANPVVFLGAQDGNVYTVDATQGGKVGFPWVTPSPLAPTVQAAPAGIFSAFDATLPFDYLLVGTRDGLGPNAFVALDPFDGSEIARYDNGGAGPGAIGIINAMAAVDYATRRVYFTSHERLPVGSTNTLWCLEMKDTAPFLEFKWARALGDIDSSPVVRNGRVYVGSNLNLGTVFSIDALAGDNPLLDRTFVHGDGQVKGFVFPDRSSDDIYFATENSVWAVADLAGGMSNKFAGGISLGLGVKPSGVLFVPGSHYVYAGGSDGKLHEIDVSGGPWQKALPLGYGTVGAPSLDRGWGLLHVGTEAGVFYAVETPLPGVMCVDDSSCLSNVGESCYISSLALCDGSCTCQVGTCTSNCCDGTGQNCAY